MKLKQVTAAVGTGVFLVEGSQFAIRFSASGISTVSGLVAARVDVWVGGTAFVL